MNEDYAVAMIEVKDADLFGEGSVASDKLALVFDLIDFDGIKNICEVGSRFAEQAYELSLIFPQANVYGFEPVPESYEICQRNLQSLSKQFYNRVKIYNLAIGERTDIIPFYPVDNTGSEYNVGASSKYKFVPGLNGSFFGKTWNQTEICVQQITLDEWRKINNIGPIDLIWIDAQGGELDAFRGAIDTLKDVKVIFSEVGIGSYYQGQSLKPEIDQFLFSQGFKELEGTFERSHQFEGNAIYVRA